MKTVREFIKELEQLPQDAYILIGNEHDEVSPTVEHADFPKLFSGHTQYNEYCVIAPENQVIGNFNVH